MSILSQDKTALGIATVVIAISSVAWAASYALMGAPMMMVDADILSNLAGPVVGLFLVVWVVGMIAMMFPAMLPVVLFYAKVVMGVEGMPRRIRPLAVSTFLGGYLLLYAALGLALYLVLQLVIFASTVIPHSLLSTGLSFGAFVVAGVYQLSSIKVRMLASCVSPIAFFSTQRRSGLIGALRMGASHGKYCVGCCWAYMLLMLLVAAMSLPFMALIAALIAFEKVITRGAAAFRSGVAVGFLALGIGSLLFPGLLTFLVA